jgi:hypothetical protein
MINLTTGNYYSLNEVGASIWNLIEAGASTTEIVERLSLRYEGAESEIESAVSQLTDELRSEDLVVAAEGNGAAPAAPEEPATGRKPFETPRLEKHTDMQDLIQLDPVHEVGEQGWPHVKADGEAARAADPVPE